MKVRDITDEAVVRAARAWQADHDQPGVMQRLCLDGAPEKVAFRACERAHKRGLLSYGTSIYHAWPTDAGLALIYADETAAVADGLIARGMTPNEVTATRYGVLAVFGLAGRALFTFDLLADTPARDHMLDRLAGRRQLAS